MRMTYYSLKFVFIFLCINLHKMWNKMLIVIVVLIVIQRITSQVSLEPERNVLIRRKRFLLFPPSTNFIQLIIGIGVPLELKSAAVVFGFAFRAVYTLPSNLSQLMPMDVNTRRKRSTTRWDMYKMLEQMFEIKGFGGRPCILRSICEMADVPLDKYNGFFEEMVHVLLTPSTTKEPISHHSDNEYYAAQNIGQRYKGQCDRVFSDCKSTFTDMFTHIKLEKKDTNMTKT